MKNTPIPVAVRTVDTGIGMKLPYIESSTVGEVAESFQRQVRQLRMMLINLLRVVVVQELVRKVVWLRVRVIVVRQTQTKLS